MKKLKVLVLLNLLIFLMATLSACAEDSIMTPNASKMAPKPAAGRSIYDSKSGTFSYITPNFGGGYDAYNASTNQFSHIRPDASGGHTTFNYRTGQFAHINSAY